MSGLMTISARLSDGSIISGKTWCGKYIGPKTLNDEQYFLFIFKNHLALSQERYEPESKEDALNINARYEKENFLVAPYHYGFCFIDFIDKTIDYYNIDSSLLEVSYEVIKDEVRTMFSKYNTALEEANRNNTLSQVITHILKADASQVLFANFVYAKSKKLLKGISFNDNDSPSYQEVNFQWSYFLNCCLSHEDSYKENIPDSFRFEIPDWKITQNNQRYISLAEFKETKDSMIKKDILNEYDLLIWELYEKEMFPENKVIESYNSKWNDSSFYDEIDYFEDI